LIPLAGVPLIVRVYNSAKKSKRLEEVYVATDSERIAETVQSYGGRVLKTSANHATGSDRIAEAIANLSADIIVNIQGDEPLIPAEVIDKTVDLFDTPDIMMTSACAVIDNPADLENPNVVKVILDKNDCAIYFSRSRIPYQRQDVDTKVTYYRHIGIYGYRRNFLLKFAKMARSPLEIAESLEQLRALENGHKIKLARVKFDFIGIDTKDDVERAERMIAERGE